MISYIKNGKTTKAARILWDKLESGQKLIFGWADEKMLVFRILGKPNLISGIEYIKTWSREFDKEIFLTWDAFFAHVKESSVTRIYNEGWGIVGS